jgi:hypothetical protein
MDPLSLVGLGLSVFGTFMQGQSASESAQAQAKSAQASAAAALYNANIADQNAAITREQKGAATEAFDRSTARTMGSTVAAYGASGVQVDSGSPMDVLADSTRSAALDRLTLQYNYDLKARDYENQAQLNRMNAANGLQAATTYASTAGNYSTAGTLNAIGTGLTGYANLSRIG